MTLAVDKGEGGSETILQVKALVHDKLPSPSPTLTPSPACAMWCIPNTHVQWTLGVWMASDGFSKSPSVLTREGGGAGLLNLRFVQRGFNA